MWCAARVMSLVVRLLTTSNFVLPAKLVCTWDAPSSREFIGKSMGLASNLPLPRKKDMIEPPGGHSYWVEGCSPKLELYGSKCESFEKWYRPLKWNKHDGLEKVHFSYKNSSFGICLFGINVEFQLLTWAATLVTSPPSCNHSHQDNGDFWRWKSCQFFQFLISPP